MLSTVAISLYGAEDDELRVGSWALDLSWGAINTTFGEGKTHPYKELTAPGIGSLRLQVWLLEKSDLSTMRGNWNPSIRQIAMTSTLDHDDYETATTQAVVSADTTTYILFFVISDRH